VDFLLVIIELFRWVLRLRCYERSDYKSALLLQRGQFGPKFQVQGIVPYQPFFLSEN